MLKRSLCLPPLCSVTELLYSVRTCSIVMVIELSHREYFPIPSKPLHPRRRHLLRSPSSISSSSNERVTLQELSILVTPKANSHMSPWIHRSYSSSIHAPFLSAQTPSASSPACHTMFARRYEKRTATISCTTA